MKLFTAALLAFAFLSACSSKSKSPPASAPAATQAADKNSKDAARKPKTPAMTAETVTCVNEKDSRTIAVASEATKSCSVTYTKFGTAENIASSTQGTDHCKNVSDRIRKNLEAAGFTCN